jgi:hypothetical protein
MWGLHLCPAVDNSANALNHKFDLHLLVRYDLLTVPTELWLDFLSNKPKHDRSHSRKLQLYRHKSGFFVLLHSKPQSFQELEARKEHNLDAAVPRCG